MENLLTFDHIVYVPSKTSWSSTTAINLQQKKQQQKNSDIFIKESATTFAEAAIL